MNQSFYYYIIKFKDEDANDPMSRLANTIHRDIAFPKHSDDFEQVSSYMESSSKYTKLMRIFDDAWDRFKY